MEDGAPKFFIDGKDEEKSNWLRFVNCARSDIEQTMLACQIGNSIYYIVHRNIPKDTELLVWYGDKFGKELKILPEEKGVDVNPSKNYYEINTILIQRIKDQLLCVCCSFKGLFTFHFSEIITHIQCIKDTYGNSCLTLIESC